MGQYNLTVLNYKIWQNRYREISEKVLRKNVLGVVRAFIFLLVDVRGLVINNLKVNKQSSAFYIVSSYSIIHELVIVSVFLIGTLI